MASNLLFSSFFYALFFSGTIPVFAATICNTTQNPSYCNTILPGNQTANLYDYCLYSIQQSLSESSNFLSLINKYLNLRSVLSTTAIYALEDCQLLAGLNMDFLQSSFQKLVAEGTNLQYNEAEDVQTLLSATLTNQLTCLDGLQSMSSGWSKGNGLFSLISYDTKLYSLSLALFTNAWVPNSRKTELWQPRKTKHLKVPNVEGYLYPEVPFFNESVNGTKNLLDETSDGLVLVSEIVTVSQNGSGNFTTIADAVAAAPNNTDASDGYFLVYITAGVYEENVSIPKNKEFLMMIGDGINQTILTGNRSMADGWTTFHTATLAVVGSGFVAVNITFRNTAGAAKGQAVAVRNGADLSTFYRCSFEGYQDTLYTHSSRQFYRECDIYGTVDFIFGNAAVVLQDCNIFARLPKAGQANLITAQGRTDPNQNTGISIQNCTIRAADDLASSNGTTKTYLGRPWKEYSRTVYMQTFMDSLIDPAGWREWNGDFALTTLYYAEFNNTGPGSVTTNRVMWPSYHVINATDASNFTVFNFLLGDIWLPQTGVPYTDGL